MFIYNNIIGLEGFIQRAVRFSQCLTACSLDEPAPHPSPATPSVAPPAPEPVKADSDHLTHAERQRRILNQLCLYCGLESHIITNSPIRPSRPALSMIQLPPMITHTSEQITTPELCFSASCHRSSSSSSPIYSRGSTLRGNSLTTKHTPSSEDRWVVITFVISPPR